MILTKCLANLLKIFTEIIRWVTIVLLLFFLTHFFEEIIDPLFVHEISEGVWAIIKALLLYVGMVAGIKKIHSSTILLLLSLFFLCLIFLEEYIINKIKFKFIEIYGTKK